MVINHEPMLNTIDSSSGCQKKHEVGSLSDRLVDMQMGSIHVHITVGSH